MGMERYTPQPPMLPGWWWMKDGDDEKLVKISRYDGHSEADGVKGLNVHIPGNRLRSLSLLDSQLSKCLWSRYAVQPPSELYEARVRVSIDRYNIEVQISDHEMLCSLAPEATLDKYFTKAMIQIFDTVVNPNRSEVREAIHEHFALLNYIGSQNPDLLNGFRAQYKRPG